MAFYQRVVNGLANSIEAPEETSVNLCSQTQSGENTTLYCKSKFKLTSELSVNKAGA